jgi:hypothetical protein
MFRVGAIAALLMALLPNPAAAGQTVVPSEPGTIRGRVADARTGAELARIAVMVEDGPTALTDDQGRYELTGVAAGARRLSVSVVGYVFVRRDVVVSPGAVIEVDIPLTEGTGTYTETVTVAAGRFHAPEPGVASQQVLGSAEIQNLRGVLADDPLRAVQVLPGVATGDDLRSEFSVRGSGFSHMNFTVDGFASPFLLHTVRAIEDLSSSGSVAMINSDILEDVTLLNGGYAQRFGNRTGGEVDFRLREGSRDRRQVRAAVSGTSASVVLEGPLGRARRGSWLFSARQSYLDLIVERLVDEGLHFRFADAQAKLVFDFTSVQRGELAILAGRSRLEGRREDPDDDDLFVGRNGSAMAIGSWRMARPRAVVTARALGSFNAFGNDALSEVPLDKGEDTQAAGRIDAAITAAPRLQFEAGAQGEWTDQARRRQRFSNALGEYRLFNDYRASGVRTGAYAQLRWTAGPLTLVPGARADRWSITGESTMSPWMQAEWRIGPTTLVRGGAGIYRQFPDFEQVVGTLGQSGARAERAVQYDLGFEQRLGAAMRFQVTLYNRDERGFFRRFDAETRLVDGRVVRGSPTAAYASRVNGYARGMEVLLQRKSPAGFTGWLSYSYGRMRQHDVMSHERFWGDLDQRHTFNAYLFYRVSDRFSVSAKLRAGSNTPAPGYFTERDGSYFIHDIRNGLRLPVYSRLDARANRTFTWGSRRLTLFAEVMNILNRENVRFNPPGVNPRTGGVSRLFEPLIPIVPSVGLLIEF